MIRPEKKKYSIPEPCGSIGDSITVEELASRVNKSIHEQPCNSAVAELPDGIARFVSGAYRPWVLTFSCNGEELLIKRDKIDAIVRTAPGSQARAGVAVSGKVFYVDDDYETVKEKVFGARV